MTIRRSAITTGCLNAFILCATVAAHAKEAEWYIFVGSEQTCEPSSSPADIIEHYHKIQLSIQPHDDVTDSTGRVVATKLMVQDATGGDLNLFRGRERCEQWIKDRSSSLDRYR
jgi:hypothetical protein